MAPGTRFVARVRPAHKNWTRRYEGFGDTMLPYEDGDPRASWEACPARHCKQLLDGRIWKCAPLAYLPMQKAKYRLADKWDPYLAYRPLEPGCSNAEIAGLRRAGRRGRMQHVFGKEAIVRVTQPAAASPKDRVSPAVV